MPQPLAVQYALRLIFCSILLGIILSGISFFQGGPKAQGLAGANLLWVSVCAGCFFFMNVGRNWARIAFGLLVFLFLPVFLSFSYGLMLGLPKLGILLSAQTLFQLGACIALFFFPSAKRWFKPTATPAPQTSGETYRPE